MALLWLLYLLRGVLFFPATLLALLSGWLLGPWQGAVVALVGVGLSLTVTYRLAHRIARRRSPQDQRSEAGRLAKLRQSLHARPFSAVLIARLTSLPGDPVNLMAGMMRIPYRPFLFASLLGGLPSLVAITWVGASLEGAFTPQGNAVDLRWLTAALALLGLAFALTLWLRQRTSQDDEV